MKKEHVIEDIGKGQQEKVREKTKKRNGKDIMHLKIKESDKRVTCLRGALSLYETLDDPLNLFYSCLHATKAAPHSAQG